MQVVEDEILGCLCDWSVLKVALALDSDEVFQLLSENDVSTVLVQHNIIKHRDVMLCRYNRHTIPRRFLCVDADFADADCDDGIFGLEEEDMLSVVVEEDLVVLSCKHLRV